MKNFPCIFPAVLTAMLLASCHSGDNAPMESQKDYSQYADSAVSGATSSARASSTTSEKVAANASGNTSTVSANKSDQSSANLSVASSSSSAMLYSTNGAVSNQLYGYTDQTGISNSPGNRITQVISSSAAKPNLFDSTHRFIRTADVKFRVKNTASATYAIENITARFGGYVANTHLVSEPTGEYTTRISEDSSLETIHFRVTNTIVLRIPVENLDTTLKSLVPLIDFLDYRNVTTNDISLEVLANILQQKRQGKYNARLSKDIDEKGKKLNDVQSAELSVLSSEEMADNAMIENRRLDDQVRYSTVTLNIYQPESFRQELVKNEKTISSYEPGFGDKLSRAAGSGWHGLRAILIFLVAIWPLWLIGAGVWVVVRRLVKNQKRS